MVTAEPVAGVSAAHDVTEVVTLVELFAHAAGLRTDPTPVEVMLKMEFAAVVTRGVNATAAEPPITAEPAVEPLPDADWVI